VDLRERITDTPRHPWEVVRARTFCRLATRYAPAPATVLDVGSGDSWLVTQLLDHLPSSTRVDCWDTHYTADDLADPPDPRLHRTAERPRTHGTAPYELVLALDVLEHIDDDRAFVQDVLASLVAPGGILVASVPAQPRLFTRHDVALGHYRRHSAGSLRDLLSPAFDILAEGSLFASLVPPRAAQRLIEMVRPPEEPVEHVQSAWRHGPMVTKVVTAVLEADARVGLATAGKPWRPPGLSVWAVCRQPADRG